MGTRASIYLGRLWRIRRPLLFAHGGLSGRVRWLFGWSEAPWLFSIMDGVSLFSYVLYQRGCYVLGNLAWIYTLS